MGRPCALVRRFSLFSFFREIELVHFIGKLLHVAGQDADIVAFLYRDDYYERGGEEEEGLPNNKVEVIIEKNRSGARGTVELIFQKEYNKFSSISKMEEPR